METKNKGFDTGIASEYLVLSMLYRLGIDAYMTLGNKKSVDIWIKNDDGSDISIDVKSVRAFDSVPVGNVVAKDNHYVVFVIYNNKFEDVLTLPEFYIVPSKYVVENRTKYDLKDGGKTYNIFKKDIKDYINRWDLLKKG
ncbi:MULTISPECIES: hypothetical protein [Bacteroides]|nr:MULTISPECIES: hypothetical protein [Bacteroides]MBS7574757.1 hypothetical protein [Bacteroides propionicigenes]RGM29346.1 hypothetical protein DXC20_05245 [Bacteroides sp. OM08-17BH]RHJ55205.1 hypothetical protein DW121_01730 [Bacteroides sp. AM10-21B]HBO05366.1 hypothetical protein [Bacteroides sp.]